MIAPPATGSPWPVTSPVQQILLANLTSAQRPNTSKIPQKLHMQNTISYYKKSIYSHKPTPASPPYCLARYQHAILSVYRIG